MLGSDVRSICWGSIICFRQRLDFAYVSELPVSPTFFKSRISTFRWQPNPGLLRTESWIYFTPSPSRKAVLLETHLLLPSNKYQQFYCPSHFQASWANDFFKNIFWNRRERQKYFKEIGNLNSEHLMKSEYEIVGFYYLLILGSTIESKAQISKALAKEIIGSKSLRIGAKERYKANFPVSCWIQQFQKIIYSGYPPLYSPDSCSRLLIFVHTAIRSFFCICII